MLLTLSLFCVQYMFNILLHVASKEVMNTHVKYFQDADGVVTCLDEQRHGYESGDFVTFSEVQVLNNKTTAPPSFFHPPSLP